jgi:hypothetical protein
LRQAASRPLPRTLDLKATRKLMSYTLEFEGSEVSSVTKDESTLVVHFSAASAIEDSSRTVGHLKSVELVLYQAVWQGNISLCFGRLSAGQITTAASSTGRIPVPYHSNSPVQVELQFRNGETLLVQSQSATLPVNGSATFFESYAC